MKRILRPIYLFGNGLIEMIGGKKFLAQRFPGVYRRGVKLRWKSFMKPGDTVVQAGVDMGTKHDKCGGSNVVYMSEIVGETGRVIAIEPTKKNIHLLKKHVHEKNIKNITLVEKALWRRKTRIPFLLGEESWHNRLETVPSEGEESEKKWRGRYTVEADTLDNILEEHQVDDPAHICMTINGAELEALEGMEKTLKTKKPTLLIASGKSQQHRPNVDGTPLNKKIAETLKKQGYKTKINPDGWINAYK